jgi:hypothetical protein
LFLANRLQIFHNLHAVRLKHDCQSDPHGKQNNIAEEKEYEACGTLLKVKCTIPWPTRNTTKDHAITKKMMSVFPVNMTVKATI